MPTAPHRIRRQRWVVRVPGRADAFDVRRQLRADLEARLLPVFERAFDAAVAAAGGGDAVVRLSRLDLRVRVPAAEGMVDALPELVGQALAEELADAVAARPREERRGGVTDDDGRQPSAAGTDPLHALLHHLRTGNVPWAYGSGPSAAAAAADLRATLRERTAEVVRAVRGTGEPAVYFRLLRLADPPVAAGLARHLVDAAASAAWSGPAADLAAALLSSDGHPVPSHARLLLAAHLLAATVGPRGDAAPDLAAVARRALTAAALDVLAVAAPRLPGAGLFNLLSLRPGPADARAADPAGYRTPARGPTDDVPARVPAGTMTPADRAAVAAALRPPVAAATTDGAFAQAVTHAGLVLLHPFLARCFDAVGIAGCPGAALLASDLPRAAALLHYLATGETTAHEHQLAFVKVLLGLSSDDPLFPTDEPLRDSDRAEADGLLAAAVGYWAALKNTSPAGLRTTFLDRPALLDRTDAGWRLRVERRAVDVLLDRLPWGFAIVKLPWMPRPLHTEW